MVGSTKPLRRPEVDKSKIKASTYCPHCKAPGYMTEWISEGGIDPRLREFKCSSCQLVFYYIPPIKAASSKQPYFP